MLSQHIVETTVQCEAIFTLFPGSIFEEYVKLGKLLGEGGYGQVYRCEVTAKGRSVFPHLQQGRSYALKRIMTALEPEKGQLYKSVMQLSSERLVQYAQALTKQECADNFIIRIQAFIVELPHAINVVMEVLEGPDLFDWVHSYKEHIPEQRTAALARQMLLAIHYLHRVVGAIHRDIKLDNFGFVHAAQSGGNIPTLKLFDLGLAMVLPEAITGETERTLLDAKRNGTLHWMAPEVFRKKCGAPSDVWGIGLIVYYMLCGKFPYDLLRHRTALAIMSGLQRNPMVSSPEA